MTAPRTAPADCTTMIEVRHGVDRLDEQIVALLAERFGYMEAAARIKPNREAVRDEDRKADVLAKVGRTARSVGMDPQIAQDLYEMLIETSIAFELRRFDATR
jgi:isochorismate pyruvate lyase